MKDGDLNLQQKRAIQRTYIMQAVKENEGHLLHFNKVLNDVIDGRDARGFSPLSSRDPFTDGFKIPNPG